MNISLKVGERTDIGGVLAPVILIMVWLAPILLDVAVGGDVVQEPAHAVFTISKIPFCTKPTILRSFRVFLQQLRFS